MKIEKIYISAFGGLKDFTLELQDGFSVIHGENENGKSTVMAFIKAMFYGTGKKSQNLAGSMRQKYTPWDGAAMGGRIFFENEGHKYSLEREFRSSDSTDRITLTDLDSGKSEQVATDIGERFFGVGSAAFERSMFIGSCAFSGNVEAEGELNLKLSNLAFTGDEDTSYPTVAKRLESAKNKLISKSGRAGSCVDDIKRHNELTERHNVADRNAQRKIEINEALSSLEGEYKKLYSEYKAVNQLLQNENDIKNAEKLQEYLDTKAQLDEINKSLTLNDGSLLDGMFVNKIVFNLNRLEKLDEKIVTIKADVKAAEEAVRMQNETSPEDTKRQIIKLNNDLNALKEKGSHLQTQIEQKSTEFAASKESEAELANRKKPVNFAILAISIVLAAAGAVLSGSILYAGIALIACGVIALILSFIVRPSDKGGLLKAQKKSAELSVLCEKLKGEADGYAREIVGINEKIELLSSMLNASTAQKAQREAELNSKTELLESENKKREAVLGELLALYGKYDSEGNPEKIKESLSGLNERTESQKQIKLRLNYLSQDLDNISYEEAAEKLKAVADRESETGIDFTAVREKANELESRLTSMHDDITAKKTELRTGFRNSENPEDLKRELSTLKETINAKKAHFDALEIAERIMEESFHEVRRSYGTEVERMTLDIFSSLTGGRYSSVSVSKSLDMAVERTDVFGTREIGYLSQGTVDQAYLSLRLAVSRLISDGKRTPILLDDSLSQYDDKRTALALEFLKDYSADTQTVMFTCHDWICQAAEAIGVTVYKPFA